MEVINIKKEKMREYQNNYVKNRKAEDEEYRLRLQTRINQHIKERLKNDEEYKIKYNETARLRKKRHTEKIRNERIELYEIKIANYDTENGDMKEYFRMCKYVARFNKTNDSTDSNNENSSNSE
jgi:hypothetical protein